MAHSGEVTRGTSIDIVPGLERGSVYLCQYTVYYILLCLYIMSMHYYYCYGRHLAVELC